MNARVHGHSIPLRLLVKSFKIKQLEATAACFRVLSTSTRVKGSEQITRNVSINCIRRCRRDKAHFTDADAVNVSTDGTLNVPPAAPKDNDNNPGKYSQRRTWTCRFQLVHRWDCAPSAEPRRDGGRGRCSKAPAVHQDDTGNWRIFLQNKSVPATHLWDKYK